MSTTFGASLFPSPFLGDGPYKARGLHRNCLLAPPLDTLLCPLPCHPQPLISTRPSIQPSTSNVSVNDSSKGYPTTCITPPPTPPNHNYTPPSRSPIPALAADFDSPAALFSRPLSTDQPLLVTTSPQPQLAHARPQRYTVCAM